MEVDEALSVGHNDLMIISTPATRLSARLFVIEKATLELRSTGYRYAYSAASAMFYAENVDVDSLEFDHLFAICRKHCYKSTDPQLRRTFLLKEPLLKYMADTEPRNSSIQHGILQSDYHAQFYFDNEATFQDWWNDFEKLRAMNSTIVNKLSQDRVPHKEMVRAAVESKNWSKLATELKQKWNIYTPPDMLGAMDEFNE